MIGVIRGGWEPWGGRGRREGSGGGFPTINHPTSLFLYSVLGTDPAGRGGIVAVVIYPATLSVSCSCCGQGVHYLLRHWP